VKVIIFDFDGTLADTLPLAIKSINQLSPKYGYRPLESVNDIELFRESSLREILTNHLGLRLYQMPGYAKQVKKIFKENFKEISIFDGIKELIQGLATKYELAIITTNSQDAVETTLDKTGILSTIKYIYANISIFGKHAIIKNFLNKHNFEPEEIIYIGDEVRDIDACKKINVKIISVTWGYNSKRSLEKSNPDYLVDSIEEIEKVMKTLAS
jgi:phosphoglycolate phosphatase